MINDHIDIKGGFSITDEALFMAKFNPDIVCKFINIKDTFKMICNK